MMKMETRLKAMKKDKKQKIENTVNVKERNRSTWIGYCTDSGYLLVKDIITMSKNGIKLLEYYCILHVNFLILSDPLPPAPWFHGLTIILANRIDIGILNKWNIFCSFGCVLNCINDFWNIFIYWV